MRSRTRNIVQTSLVVLFIATFPCSESWAVPILDQSWDASAVLPSNRKIAGYIYGPVSPGSGRPLDRAQIFTVGVAGALTDIKVMVGRYSASDPILWEVRNVSSGQPGSTILANGSTAASSFPLMGSQTSFPTSLVSLGAMSFNVNLGDVLAIHLHTAEPTFGAYGWRSTTNVYAGGSQFTQRLNSDRSVSEGWLPATSQGDPIYAGFQTWVDPAVVPEPATLLLLAAGFFGLFGHARRKK